jgi:hypothetical protein
MSSFAKHQASGLAGLLAVSTLCSTVTLADEARAPRYTYLGAGYEWGESRCAIEPPDGGLSGYAVEGSVGLLRFLHLVGAYYDGDFDARIDGGEGVGLVKTNIDLKCYELGAGVSYNFAPGADIIARANYVKVESDDFAGDGDGLEPQLLVRYMVSDKAEVELGVNYFDIDLDDDVGIGDSVSNTELRLSLDYAVLPWLAVRVGASVFDDDSAVNAGFRAYFGGNLF